MKIIVSVVQRRYGSIEIELPDDDPVFGEGAETSMRARKTKAQSLARKVVEEHPEDVDWSEPEEPDVEFGYFKKD